MTGNVIKIRARIKWVEIHVMPDLYVHEQDDWGPKVNWDAVHRMVRERWPFTNRMTIQYDQIACCYVIEDILTKNDPEAIQAMLGEYEGLEVE